jgi:NAD+ kinase
MVIRSVGVSLKPHQPQLADVVRSLETWLSKRGLEVVLEQRTSAAAGGETSRSTEVGEKVDLMLVLGGDGTLLSVAPSGLGAVNARRSR